MRASEPPPGRPMTAPPRQVGANRQHQPRKQRPARAGDSNRPHQPRKQRPARAGDSNRPHQPRKQRPARAGDRPARRPRRPRHNPAQAALPTGASPLRRRASPARRPRAGLQRLNRRPRQTGASTARPERRTTLRCRPHQRPGTPLVRAGSSRPHQVSPVQPTRPVSLQRRGTHRRLDPPQRQAGHSRPTNPADRASPARARPALLARSGKLANRARRAAPDRCSHRRRR